MSVNIILTGRNHQLISDFFQEFSQEFKYYTSSMIKADLINHIELVKPAAVVCCISNESDDVAYTMAEIRDILADNKICMVIIGTAEDESKFQRYFSFAADLILHKPIENEEIYKQIKHTLQFRGALKKTETPKEAPAPLVTPETKKHVLVIDDDPIMLKLIKEHLKDDYNVGLSNNGLTALKYLETKTTDLIILDYEMPGMNGPEVLVNIRNNKKLAEIPVVFLTGTKDREKVQNALMLKPQGYLLKPIEKDKLMEMLKNLIG